MSTALTAASDHSLATDLLEAVVASGDLGKLTPTQRAEYLTALCKSLGLNVLSRPIEFITLQGKTVPYVKRDACDQLRRIHGISFDPDVKTEVVDGVMTKTVVARTPEGRTDVECGSVVIANLKGADLANATMKSLTKAKRRATLSICGLGFMSEDELDTVGSATVQQDNRRPLRAAPAEVVQVEIVPPSDVELTEAENELLAAAQDTFEQAEDLKALNTAATAAKKSLPVNLHSHLQAPYFARKKELTDAK